MMMLKLDLKNLRLPHFDPRYKRVNAKRQHILQRKWPLTRILCIRQKSHKLDEGILLIFVSGKNRPLLLAKGVHS